MVPFFGYNEENFIGKNSFDSPPVEGNFIDAKGFDSPPVEGWMSAKRTDGVELSYFKPPRPPAAGTPPTEGNYSKQPPPRPPAAGTPPVEGNYS